MNEYGTAVRPAATMEGALALAARELGAEADADREVGRHPLDVLIVPHALLTLPVVVDS